MRQLYLDGLYRKTRKLDMSFCSPEASKRVEKIKIYQQLRLEGCSETIALKAIQISRATYYRWQKALSEKGPKGLNAVSRRPKSLRPKKHTRELESLVLKLRTENPLYGRLKIHALLKRDFTDFTDASVATIGRILKRLLDLKRIYPVWLLSASKKSKRRRKFNQYARRWKYGMKAEKPGELIQVDHMSVSLETSKTVKHFQATCPLTKITIVEAFSVATSAVAAKFLKKIKEEMPFSLLSIQVDGGSEFMKHFETACKEEKIALFVLPPKSPKYNGCVERRNATFKYEFYYQYRGDDSMEAMRTALNAYQVRYNTYRPHQALQQNTPWEYYQKNHALVA